ncbi:MAG: tRNA pseudouridine(38-40) synthase TruA [Prolixibacteraceae bacterium]|jgi:tRNA pseudouridine38-40 synthase|nr:tRNA pseudouridine(38-40) synthase TruA [Prolixibacteraceae bacterium]
MVRYFIQLAYNGANYHGWQVQPNALTVQEVLAKAIATITRENIDLVGAGRTDTGVHASFFVAHFELPEKLNDENRFVFKLNSFLPNDINIEKIFQVSSDLHARFSATARTYLYYITTKKEPFRDAVTAFTPYCLDMDRMNDAAKCLLDYIDFTSFSKLHTDVKTNNCIIMEAVWFEEDGMLVFRIKADRFLRNMVRAIVGTLIDVGRGKISNEQFRKIVEDKQRGKAGASALAKGLFLSGIEYPEPYNSEFLR